MAPGVSGGMGLSLAYSSGHPALQYAKKVSRAIRTSMGMSGKRRIGGRRGSEFGGRRRRGNGMEAWCGLDLLREKCTRRRTPMPIHRAYRLCMTCGSRLRSPIMLTNITIRLRRPHFNTSHLDPHIPMRILIPGPPRRTTECRIKDITARVRSRNRTLIRTRTRVPISRTTGTHSGHSASSGHSPHSSISGHSHPQTGHHAQSAHYAHAYRRRERSGSV